MDTTEVGAYMLLLCAAWKSENVGCLPDDDLVLSRLCRLSETKFKNRKSIIMSGFRLDGNTYKQSRMITEFEKIKNVSEKNSSSGKIGNEKRWKKNKAINPINVESCDRNRDVNAIAKLSPEDRQSDSYIESNNNTNVLLNPLTPWEGEQIPDEQKLQRKKIFDPKTIGIPDSLNDPVFIFEWVRWIDYRLQLKPKPLEQSWRSQLESLARWGPVVASEAIRRTIQNSWKGLFPESVAKEMETANTVKKGISSSVSEAWLEKKRNEERRLHEGNEVLGIAGSETFVGRDD
jgi:uncharacterized protein YdaU (DUF1376 family)